MQLEYATLTFMELMIEVPGTALLDLVELAEIAAEQMRMGDAPPALADALRGAAEHVRTSVCAPA